MYAQCRTTNINKVGPTGFSRTLILMEDLDPHHAGFHGNSTEH